MQTRTLGYIAPRLVLALSLAIAGTGAWAQDKKDEDHTAHHPADAASAPKTAPKPAVKPASTKAQPLAADKAGMEKLGQMDAQMKTMQDLHQKFMAAKTPEERMALMPEHMKAMQDGMIMMEDVRASMGSKRGMGMGMMGDKGGMGMMGSAEGASMMGKMPMDMMAKHQMMEKRMDMMQSMMQMMMDRMQLPATK